MSGDFLHGERTKKRERTPIERVGGALNVLTYSSRLLLYSIPLLHRSARNPAVCVRQLFCTGRHDKKEIEVFENLPSFMMILGSHADQVPSTIPY